MDPISALSLASSCLSIVSNAGTLILRITIFVSEVRSARRDLDAVSRELTTLQLCVSALKDDQQLGISTLPQDMKNNLNQILVNIQLIVNQISDMLIKLSSGRLGRRIQWAMTERDEMNKFRSSLESNKLALEVALTLSTISMLAKQEQTVARQDDKMFTLIQQTGEISTTTNLITNQLDKLTKMHRNNKNMQGIASELAELRSQLLKLSNGIVRPEIANFIDHAEAYKQSLLQPLGPLPSPPPESSTHSATSDPFADTSTEDQSTLEAARGLDACPVCLRIATSDVQADGIHRFITDVNQERDDRQAAVEREQARTATLAGRVTELESKLKGRSGIPTVESFEPLENHLNNHASQTGTINRNAAIPLLEVCVSRSTDDRADLTILSACFVSCENEPDLKNWNRTITEQLRLMSAHAKEQPRIENIAKTIYFRKVQQHVIELAVGTPQAHLFTNERIFLHTKSIQLASMSYGGLKEKVSDIRLNSFWVMLLPQGHKFFDSRTVVEDPLKHGVTRVVIDGENNAYATFQRKGENPSIVFCPTGSLARTEWRISTARVADPA
ncbi:hypothetical protein H2198_003172 [Neophaeococcomyces mojaviensis]|uniref:Uncharacterized protein n=1 Tax=Neophaeococcomyces mojaviensis TaxID=3383035 RepID=A0ACC3AC29_9EURO|nr:hypothetical protein H2198_003172 [Knufia sp. JES_112]